MNLIAESTVTGTHNYGAGRGMVRTGFGPFVRASAIAYVVAPVAFEVVAAAVLSFVAAAAAGPFLDSSVERGS